MLIAAVSLLVQAIKDKNMDREKYDSMLEAPNETVDYEVLPGHTFRKRIGDKKVVFNAGETVPGLRNAEAAHWVHVNSKLKRAPKQARPSKK